MHTRVIELCLKKETNLCWTFCEEPELATDWTKETCERSGVEEMYTGSESGCVIFGDMDDLILYGKIDSRKTTSLEIYILRDSR